MQIPVEELFVQVEREAEYDSGYEHGYNEDRTEGRAEGRTEGKDEMILGMLEKSFDLKVIEDISGCSIDHILNLKRKYFPSK